MRRINHNPTSDCVEYAILKDEALAIIVWAICDERGWWRGYYTSPSEKIKKGVPLAMYREDTEIVENWVRNTFKWLKQIHDRQTSL